MKIKQIIFCLFRTQAFYLSCDDDLNRDPFEDINRTVFEVSDDLILVETSGRGL